MSIRGDVLQLGALRRWLGHLVLFAFVCRALIPIGFMPDFAAASKGVYKVVICTGYGPQAVELDANGHKIPSKPGKLHHQLCAFSSATAVASLSFAEINLAPTDFIAEVAPRRIFEELPPVRAGPAVGPRAPPRIS